MSGTGLVDRKAAVEKLVIEGASQADAVALATKGTARVCAMAVQHSMHKSWFERRVTDVCDCDAYCA